MELLLIDFDDSFTHNLAQLFGSLGVRVAIRRHRSLTLAGISERPPDWICLSPGPMTPAHYPLGAAVVRSFGDRIPLLGVCLGMQILNETLGGGTSRAPVPVHGKRTPVRHDGQGIFGGIPSPFQAARYHSLRVDPVAPALAALAWSGDGLVMGLQHPAWPLCGVQFHPESFLTEHGPELIANFLDLRPDAAARISSGTVEPAVPIAGPGRPGTPAPWLPRRVRRVSRSVTAGIDDARFLDEAAACLNEGYSTLLLSGGPVAGHARHSILARDPFLCFQSKGDRIRIETPAGTFQAQGDPFAVLDRLLDPRLPGFAPGAGPFEGGAVGYFAYELKNRLEPLPQTASDDLDLPDILLFFPGEIRVHDRRERTVTRLRLAVDGWENQALPPMAPRVPPAGARSARRAPRSNFRPDAYERAVARVREYIAAGDVYQVDLSQRFTADFAGDPVDLWRRFFERDPGPFYSFVQAGSHQVLSTSMERFLRRRGDRVETCPIKGTRRRGVTPEEDAALRAALLSDPKDDAELCMIVDLMRNDLGRVCRPGSVRVAAHKRVESYRNVFHLVSTVTGRLLPGTGPVALLRATFPGGSVTGCPKIRAMEIIDELEPQVRHVYTGAIGYLGWNGDLDLSVAIRTAVCAGGRCSFAAGGGVVFDSDPRSEYAETLHKAGNYLQLLSSAPSGAEPPGALPVTGDGAGGTRRAGIARGESEVS